MKPGRACSCRGQQAGMTELKIPGQKAAIPHSLPAVIATDGMLVKVTHMRAVGRLSLFCCWQSLQNSMLKIGRCTSASFHLRVRCEIPIGKKKAQQDSYLVQAAHAEEHAWPHVHRKCFCRIWCPTHKGPPGAICLIHICLRQ